jgi:threonine dehydratase
VRLNVEEAPAEIWLKLENLQPIGSFKLRGAGNAIALAPEERIARGVYTASAGNMAQGLAWSARRRGIPCSVVVPDHAPATKLAAIERLGARAIKVPFERWWRVIEEHDYPGLEGLFVHPVSDPAVIAGNGTIGLEIVEDLPDVTSVLIPTSGGGLSAGVSTAVRALASAARIIGVEPELAADAKESLERDELVTWTAEETGRTMADGLRTNSLGLLPFEHLRRFMDAIVTVSEDGMADAMRQLARRARLVVEPSGAAAMGAHLAGSVPRVDGDDRRVVILSGGNVDPELFVRILSG